MAEKKEDKRTNNYLQNNTHKTSIIILKKHIYYAKEWYDLQI
jgi:hypothetical protein